MSEGVVGALRTLHGVLRPEGLLVDLHPVAEDARLEVEVGGQVTSLGPLPDPTLLSNIVRAEAVLRATCAAGAFVRERATTFEFIYHFDGVDAWRTYMAERWIGAEIDPDAAAHAQTLLAQGSGDLRIRQIISAERLRRG